MPNFKTKGTIYLFHNEWGRDSRPAKGYAYALCEDGRMANKVLLPNGTKDEVLKYLSEDDGYSKFYPDGYTVVYITQEQVIDNSVMLFNNAVKLNLNLKFIQLRKRGMII